MDLVVDGNDTVPSRQGSPCPCVSVVVVGSVGVCSCVCDAHVHMMEVLGYARACRSAGDGWTAEQIRIGTFDIMCHQSSGTPPPLPLITGVAPLPSNSMMRCEPCCTKATMAPGDSAERVR
eukprot:1161463-Pelagomonas_calceolata.AAC.7